MKTTAIFGPPGTGKTTEMTRLIADAVKSSPDVAVVSFSRAAAEELAARTVVKPAYIGTIHAHCFAALNLDRAQVAQMEEATSMRRFKTEARIGLDDADIQWALNVYNYARNTHTRVEDAYARFTPQHVSPGHMALIVTSYQEWKKAYYLVDFTDMLVQATGIGNTYGIVFVDEAQDLSKLQWEVVFSMVKADGRLIAAGDDDQAIFTWAGAYPHGMAELTDSPTVLGQSHRVPRAIYDAANRVVRKIHKRQNKDYQPRNADGSLQRTMNIDHVLDLWRGKTFTVMCRDRYVMRDVETELQARHFTYVLGGSRYGKGLFYGRRGDAIRAIMDADGVRAGKLKSYMNDSAREQISAGQVPKDWRWAVRLSPEEMSYFESVDPMAPPQVLLSTIHAQKGKEFDRGVIVAACSGRVESLQDQQADRDDELRVWYTALTRIREEGVIVGTNAFISR